MKSKYATITLNTESSPYTAKVDWHTGIENKPSYFTILESKNLELIEQTFDDWISTKISHRHSFKIEPFDIENINLVPFVISDNSNESITLGRDKVTELVRKWIGNQRIMNETDLTQLDLLIQETYSGSEYYCSRQIEENIAELTNLPNDWQEHGNHPFAGWLGATQKIWVETALVNHSLHGAKSYEPSEEAKKLGVSQVFHAKSTQTYNSNANYFRLYQKVGNQFQYVLTYQNDGEVIPSSAYPMWGIISGQILAKKQFENPLEISLLNSAKQIIDQYDTKIPVSHLRNPKKEGCAFWIKNTGIYIRIEQDNIIGNIWKELGTEKGFDTGFKIPILEVMDKNGYITETMLRKYFDGVKKILLRSSEKEILEYFNITSADEIFISAFVDEDDVNADIIKNRFNAQGKTLASILLDTQLGYLSPKKIQHGTYHEIRCENNEDTMQAIFYALKALLLLRMPAVKEQIKRDTKIARQDRKNHSLSRANKRRFWGSNKITYLFPESTGITKGRKYHFVRGFIRKNNNGTLSDVKPHYRGDLGLGISNTILTFGKGGGGYSQAALDWIKSVEKSEGISIRHAESGGEYRVTLPEGKFYKVDGFCEATRTIYEFHGDCWHGNLDVYSPEDCPHPHRPDTTAQQLYDETKMREEALKALGYNLVVMWENDWQKVK